MESEKIDWQTNRAKRRIFKKKFGVMLPAKYFPHVKSDGYANCRCINCNDRRIQEKIIKPTKKNV